MPKDAEGHNYFFGGLPEMPYKKKRGNMEVEIDLGRPTEYSHGEAERIHIFINKKRYDLWEKDGQLIITVFDRLSIFPRSANSIALEVLREEPNV